MTPVAPTPSAISGNLYVIAAPSGTGKSSLVQALLQQDPRLTLCISHTTRAPRGQEQNGREYWFTPENEFKRMIDDGDFVEWACVHGNYYGTSRKEIENCLQKGLDIILEIDWQGALQIRHIFDCATLIFILPPSWEALRSRLQARGEDSLEVIQTRLNSARVELTKAKAFNFVIINSAFEAALLDLQTIIGSQRLRYACQQKHNAHIFEQLGAT